MIGTAVVESYIFLQVSGLSATWSRSLPKGRLCFIYLAFWAWKRLIQWALSASPNVGGTEELLYTLCYGGIAPVIASSIGYTRGGRVPSCGRRPGPEERLAWTTPLLQVACSQTPTLHSESGVGGTAK